jgi:hypothetical protein
MCYSDLLNHLILAKSFLFRSSIFLSLTLISHSLREKERHISEQSSVSAKYTVSNLAVIHHIYRNILSNCLLASNEIKNILENEMKEQSRAEQKKLEKDNAK